MGASHRFQDTSASVYDFMGEVLVVCPKCDGRARTYRIDSSSKDWFAPRRLGCLRCGHTKDWSAREISRHWHGEPRDDYFELPLWLQTPCAGETLWAYNREHLDFIEAFVTAEHRERTRDQRWGWANGSLASRFPKWLKAAKNRPTLLQAVLRLRDRLEEDAG